MREIPKKEIKMRPQERGMILVVAMMVVIVMLIMALPFLSKLSSQNRATVRSAWSLSALNLAEAGVDKFLWKVNYSYYIDPAKINPDPEKIVWTTAGSNKIGTIASIETSDDKIIGNKLEPPIVSMILFPRVDNGALPATQLLESTGNVPFIASNPPAPVKRTVRAYLEEYYDSIWEYGFFVNNNFKAQTQFGMDAYDSGDGPYGAPNADLDAYFGANSYDYGAIDSFYSWGSNDIHGFLAAGGTEAGLHNLDPSYPAPDPAKLNDVITMKGVDDNVNLLMTEEYKFPPVDVYNLPPKETMPTPFSSVENWFNTSPDYEPFRFDRAPEVAEIKSGSTPTFWGGTHTFAGSGTLTPAQSGVYTSFVIGNYGTSGTLNVSGGNVVIYVTALGDIPATTGNAGKFYMGDSSNINIAADSSLTIILGNTSFSVEQGFQVNTQNNSSLPAPPAPLPAKCVILGTEQFSMPSNLGTYKQGNKLVPRTPADLEGMKATDADALKIPGFMLFEHGAGQKNGKIYSAMYIPKGYFISGQGANNLDFFGSLLCDSMRFKTQVSFHYDKALADYTLITGGFPEWKLVSLQEKVPAN
jgi:hypothetical protein